MLTAIDLDDEAAFQTREIENVTAERNLPAEFVAAKKAHPQFRP